MAHKPGERYACSSDGLRKQFVSDLCEIAAIRTRKVRLDAPETGLCRVHGYAELLRRRLDFAGLGRDSAQHNREVLISAEN